MTAEARRDPTSADDDAHSQEGSTRSNHLTPEDFYDAIENRLPRSRKRRVEAHLADCPECIETLAMILREERPASREEQQALATMEEPSVEAMLAGLRPHIEASSPEHRAQTVEWRPVAGVVLALVVAVTSTLWLRQTYWLPAASRRAATDTLSSMVELRQSTGRIPLRYINEFERAGVVRSGFDDTGHIEQALLDGLREAVSRAPEPEAVLTLGLLLLDEGELDDAERLLRTIVDSDPRSVDALNGLAVVSYERAEREAGDRYGNLQRGLALLRQAQAVAPDDLRVLYNFGKFYDALEMEGPAHRAWNRYLAADPSSQWSVQASLELQR